jgi:DNA polymerase-3 subunit alpha
MVAYIGECREMGIPVLPPDANESDIFFTVVPGAPAGRDAIRFGLAAIKNVGEGAVQAILDARRAGGPFRSLFDFCERVDLRAVNRRVVESFVKSGSFDSLDPRRAALFACIDRAMDSGQKGQRDRAQGQSSLFGMLSGAEDGPPPVERVPDVPAWGEGERLANEKESLGFFITGHPLERYRTELAQWATATTARLLELGDGREVTVGGIVAALRLIKTRKGDRMATFILEDLEGGVEALVFPETYKKVAARLAEDQVVLVKGRAEVLDEGKARLLVSELLPLEQGKLAEARYVTIRVPMDAWDRARGERLREILVAHRGDCPVTLELFRPGAYAVAVAPNGYYKVRPDDALRAELEDLLGPGALLLSRTNGRTEAMEDTANTEKKEYVET